MLNNHLYLYYKRKMLQRNFLRMVASFLDVSEKISHTTPNQFETMIHTSSKDPMLCQLFELENEINTVRVAYEYFLQHNKEIEIDKPKIEDKLVKQQPQPKVEKEPKDKEPKDKEPKDKEPKDKETKDKESKDKETKDKESKDKESKDKESKDKETKDKETKDKEPKDKEPKKKTEKKKEKPVALEVVVASLVPTVQPITTNEVTTTSAVPGEDIDDVKLPIHLRRKGIPKYIKSLVWNKYMGENNTTSKCVCCMSQTIDCRSFHCGHVISEAKGGDLSITNLRPICASCNLAMSTKSMNEFCIEFFKREIPQ